MYNIEILKKENVNLEKSLELFGDMETYNNTLIDFYKELDNKLLNLKKFKENGDMSNYAVLVHSLKSDAKYFGFDDFSQMCLDHEMKSKSNDVYYISENFTNLMQKGIKIANVIREYLGDNTKLSIINENEKIKEKSGKILVVDDSNIISNFISSIFSNSYEIIEAKDGATAIEKLSDSSLKIDCMLLDLNLPNINGYEVLNYMKVNNISNNIKVAIITGSDAKSVLDNIKDYKVDVIVEKPFNEATIKTVVEKLVKKDA